MSKLTKLESLKALAQKVNTDYAKKSSVTALEERVGQVGTGTPTKVSDLTNDSKYQTEDEVTAAINAKVASTYKAGGSVAFADLPELTEANLGLVVNVTDKFTTTDDFVEGAGTKHPAGANVVVAQAGEAYKYDVLAGFVDLSGYMEKEEGKVLSSNDYTSEEKAKLAGLEIATDAEVTAMLNEVFGAAQEAAE